MLRSCAVALALLAACNARPAFLEYQRELELLNRIDSSFGESVDAEKSAVLAGSDQESTMFAAESKKAAETVSRDIQELYELMSPNARPAELEKLATLSATWKNLREIDSRLLTLAVANTNLKAMQLSAGDAAAALDRLVAALGEIAAKSSDPEMIRDVSNASIAALQIQALHAPHIASADAAEMDRLEGRMHDSGEVVERVLKELASNPRGADREQIEKAAAAWKEYDRASAEVVRLSRTNTDVRAFDISVHEKRRAAEAFREAVVDLTAEVRSSLPATR